MLKHCFLVYEKTQHDFLALRHLAVCTKTFFLFFSFFNFWKFWRKPGILISDLYFYDIKYRPILSKKKHLCMQPCFCWNLRVISYLNCFNKRKRQKKCLNACIFSPLQRHSCIFTVFFFFFKTKKVFNPKVLKPKTRGSDNQARPKRLGLGFGFCLWSILKSLFIIFHLSFMDFIFTFLFSNTINTLMESQSIDQLRITFVAVLKLYLIALSERLPSQSGMPRSLGYYARLMRLGLATMPDPSN